MSRKVDCPPDVGKEGPAKGRWPDAGTGTVCPEIREEEEGALDVAGYMSQFGIIIMDEEGTSVNEDAGRLWKPMPG
jgi:hypothetical protein